MAADPRTVDSCPACPIWPPPMWKVRRFALHYLRRILRRHVRLTIRRNAP